MSKPDLYGGPYANENDLIDAALREDKLDELVVSKFSRGARALIETYKKEETFTASVGDFVNNSVFHPSDDIEEVPEEENPAQGTLDLDKL